VAPLQALKIERRPIAVYGTLRVGGGNDRLWRGMARASRGWSLSGWHLVDAGAFPYIVEADARAAVVVDLVIPHFDRYDDVVEAMDWLEGVPSHYRREPTVAHRDGEWREVWVYVPAEPVRGVEVPGGDWIEHVSGDHR
jgi:gamma-glutamylcyclotransferase (GGCT)/AIG2-like uncharacterized protein YtfP